MTVQRKDLTDISDKDYNQRQTEFMQCQECGLEFGGTRGDYFSVSSNYIFVCGECESTNIALVKRVMTTVKV